MARPIQRLSEEVVSRIAAGEVIHRPASALKELLENSIDAGSTSISVRAAGGGLTSLTIQDNGCGIRQEDLGIVCERFTTSKLKQFEDLREIGTYGFRGEALASISHVSKLSITSKTGASPCAFRAQYIDGKLVNGERPKACAGVQGTTIAVEDIFYNMGTRRGAVKSGSEEYTRILDVVSKYAVHKGLTEEEKSENAASADGAKHLGVGMVCKKQNNAAPDVHTTSGDSKLDNIRSIYGSVVANELIKIKEESHEFKPKRASSKRTRPGAALSESDDDENDDDEDQAFGDAVLLERNGSWCFQGYVSNANYNRKKSTFIFFINERLVDVPTLKRALDALYAEYLPKGTHPFAYISITMPSKHVDVNVSPNKREVHFLYEDSIVNQIAQGVRQQLIGSNSSRVFYTQQTITTANELVTASQSSSQSSASRTSAYKAAEVDDDGVEEQVGAAGSQTKLSKFGVNPKSVGGIASGKKRKYEPNKLVRTDPKARKLDEFFAERQDPAPSPVKPATLGISNPDGKQANKEEVINIDITTGKGEPAFSSGLVRLPSGTFDNDISEEALELSSIQELVGEFESRVSPRLKTLFADIVFVGWVDEHFMLVQIHTGLFILDFVELFRELFYQQTLRKFGQFPRIVLETPVCLETALVMALHARNDIEEAIKDQTEGKREDKDPNSLPAEANLASGKPCQAVLDKAKSFAQMICSRSAMLDEYFRVSIDPEKGLLRSLPEVVKGYKPLPASIAPFLVRLCENVHWRSEKDCFDTLAAELAEMYAQFPRFEAESEDDKWQTDESDPRYMIRNVLFPHLRNTLVPYKEHADASKGFVRQIAALEQMYKIFERC